MTRDVTVVWLLVEVAELPNDGIDPLVGVVVAPVVPFRRAQSLADDVVQPLAHSTGKVFEDRCLALFDLLAFTVVVDVHVLVVIITVVCNAWFTDDDNNDEK